MAGSKYFDNIYGELIEKATKVAQELYEEAKDKAIKEVSADIPEDLETIYREAVSAWYRAYIPSAYSRNYSLYSLIDVERGGDAGNGIGWKVSGDNMTKAQWGKGSFNPWYQIYYGGYHGGPIGRRTMDGDFITMWSPPHSAPIPNLFQIGIDELETAYGLRVKSLIRDEVQRNFNSRFNAAR